jgi:hypothetical protein
VALRRRVLGVPMIIVWISEDMDTPNCDKQLPVFSDVAG